MSEVNLAKQFEEHLIDSGKSMHTMRAYGLDLQIFEDWFEQANRETFDAQAVGPRDVIEFRQHLVEQGLKPATVNRRLVSLQRFFRWAHRAGIITDTPFEGIEKLRIRHQASVAPKWLGRRKQLALLRAVRRGKNVRDAAIIELMMNGGLRVSEVVHLTLTDIQLGERSGVAKIRSGKGNKFREIPLARDTRRALQRYIAHRGEQESDHLFEGQRGPLHVPGVRYLVSKYAYQARLSDVTPHTLRHTFGKNLVDQGVSLDQVAALLGHETLETVMIYTRPSRQDLENAVRKAAGEIV